MWDLKKFQTGHNRLCSCGWRQQPSRGGHGGRLCRRWYCGGFRPHADCSSAIDLVGVPVGGREASTARSQLGEPAGYGRRSWACNGSWWLCSEQSCGFERVATVSQEKSYTALEQRLLEDWEDAGNQPGLTASTVSARGWLEHRSRIQSFPASIRAGWALAGIWDCLRGGRHEEARARAGLALAQLDQQACDRGSFLLASEVSLESAPP